MVSEMVEIVPMDANRMMFGSTTTDQTGCKSDFSVGLTSFDAFMQFVKYEDTDGVGQERQCDASGILTRKCYEMWLQTRRARPVNPEDTFRRTIIAHLSGTKKRKPFPREVETSLLSFLRMRKVWAAFDGYLDEQGKPYTIGKTGFRAKGYHERRDEGQVEGKERERRKKPVHSTAPVETKTIVNEVPQNVFELDELLIPFYDGSGLSSTMGEVGQCNLAVGGMVVDGSRDRPVVQRDWRDGDEDILNCLFDSEELIDSTGNIMPLSSCSSSSDLDSPQNPYELQQHGFHVPYSPSYQQSSRMKRCLSDSIENLVFDSLSALESGKPVEEQTKEDNGMTQQQQQILTTTAKTRRIGRRRSSALLMSKSVLDSLFDRMRSNPSARRAMEQYRREWENDPEALMLLLNIFGVSRSDYEIGFADDDIYEARYRSPENLVLNMNAVAATKTASLVKSICFTARPGNFKQTVMMFQPYMRSIDADSRMLHTCMERTLADPRFDQSFRTVDLSVDGFDYSKPIGRAVLSAATGKYVWCDEIGKQIVGGDPSGQTPASIVKSLVVWYCGFFDIVPKLMRDGFVSYRSWTRRMDGTPYLLKMHYEMNESKTEVMTTFQDCTYLHQDLIELPPFQM